MKYVKGFNFQVCIRKGSDLVASFYFETEEEAKKVFNDLTYHCVYGDDCCVSVHNYALQLEMIDFGYDSFL